MLIILCILLINIIATVLFSNVVFERFYINAKYNELKDYAGKINKYFAEMDISLPDFRANLINAFDEIERNNIEIIWFIYNPTINHADIGYATKITEGILPTILPTPRKWRNIFPLL